MITTVHYKILRYKSHFHRRNCSTLRKVTILFYKMVFRGKKFHEKCNVLECLLHRSDEDRNICNIDR